MGIPSEYESRSLQPAGDTARQRLNIAGVAGAAGVHETRNGVAFSNKQHASARGIGFIADAGYVACSAVLSGRLVFGKRGIPAKTLESATVHLHFSHCIAVRVIHDQNRNLSGCRFRRKILITLFLLSEN